MNCVIPARDNGIQEFYRVGEYKSYVKIHHFMGNLIPVSSTRMTKKGDTGMIKKKCWEDKKGALKGQEKGLLGDTIIK
ncbi:MAG: hypothetical protein ACR5KX_00985 [Wolbachia sp.]